MAARGERTRPDLLGDAEGFPVRRLGLAGLGGVRSGVDLAEDPQRVCLAMSRPRGARELEHALGSVPRLRQSAGEQVAFTERAQDPRQDGDEPDGGGLLRRLLQERARLPRSHRRRPGPLPGGRPSPGL